MNFFLAFSPPPPPPITFLMVRPLLNADWSKRGQFFLISFHRGENYLLLIGRVAKKLAPDWLSTPFLHLVGFFILCRDNNNFFQVLWSLTFSAGLFPPKILGYQVLQLQRKFLKVNFRFLQKAAKDYLCQKLKS